MSSLQKFHRRTTNPIIISPFPTIGSGSATIGYWLGDITTNKLVVAPKTTEVQLAYGSYNIGRGANSITDGLANTNTLYAFGSAAHPAAYYCKTLATGGYNNWFLPAKNDIILMYANRGATPFAASNSFGGYYWSSTEMTDRGAFNKHMVNGNEYTEGKGNVFGVRAVRRSTI